MIRRPRTSPLFPYPTLFRSVPAAQRIGVKVSVPPAPAPTVHSPARSEEHTSELQSHLNLVCRLLLEKKKSRLPWCLSTTPKDGPPPPPPASCPRTLTSRADD